MGLCTLVVVASALGGTGLDPVAKMASFCQMYPVGQARSSLAFLSHVGLASGEWWLVVWGPRYSGSRVQALWRLEDILGARNVLEDDPRSINH